MPPSVAAVGAAEDDAQRVRGERAEQDVGRGGLDETAVVEDRDVVADPLDVVEDVGRVEDRGLALELAHQVEDVLATDRVERRDRLVEQDHRRPADEGLGDPEALAHAARVGRRAAVGRLGDADALEQLADLALAIGADAAEPGDVAKRLAAGHPAVEPRILGEVAELAAMVAGRRDRHAVDRRAAGRRAGEPGEDLEGGGLAGAVRAEEAEDRARPARPGSGRSGPGRPRSAWSGRPSRWRWSSDDSSSATGWRSLSSLPSLGQAIGAAPAIGGRVARMSRGAGSDGLGRESVESVIGISATTSVPWPGGLSIGQRAADRRDAVLEAADAGAAGSRSAPPTPSSPTSTRSVVRGTSAPTLALRRAAYLATLASASETTK